MNEIRMSGVRHDAEHSLVTAYGALGYGERQMRPWECTCGTQFGSLYDNRAREVYRAHRRRKATK